jgi:hypothetical protein
MRLEVLAGVLAMSVAGAASAAAPLDAQFYIARQYVDAQGPAVQLANGRVYRLGRRAAKFQVPKATSGALPDKLLGDANARYPGSLPTWFQQPTVVSKPAGPGRRTSPPPTPPASRAPAAWPAEPAQPVARLLRVQTLPTSVEIPGLSGRVRDQDGRDTCTWFAATMGLEAAYLARGVDVRLSPEYFNNILKMHLIAPDRALPLTEIQPGIWGGGSILTNLVAMRDVPFGLSEETDDPYVPLGPGSANPPPGDVWVISGDVTQADNDGVSLSDGPITLVDPAGVTLTPLSVASLANAAYRATAITSAGPGDLTTLDWYRQQLANGLAVVIQFHCCGSQAGDVWTPAGDLSAEHALTLIGYDDGKKAFLARNSWGENAARWFSYDFATSGNIDTAVTVTAVAPVVKPQGLPGNLQVLLGRWFLTEAGQPGRLTSPGGGRLDIYRIPNPDHSVGRLGTFFAEDGTQFRVNGRFTPDPGKPPGALEMFLDTANPDAPFTAAQGQHRTATYLFAAAPGALANGMMVGSTDGGGVFILRKAAALPDPPAALSAPRPDNQALIGWWRIYWEGEAGSLVFSRFDANAGRFVGVYQPDGGQSMTAWGAVNANGIAILTDAPAVRYAGGAFADPNRVTAAGHGMLSNPATAFVAVLRSTTPAITLPYANGALGPQAP